MDATETHHISGAACPVHQMACMEIWGGNRAIEEAVSTTGIDAWISSRPYHGDHAGGDVHYVSMCAGGKICRFAVADVSGHGASVDGFAQALRTLMRRYINTPDQSRFTRELNRQFTAVSDGGIFATALLATYFAPTDQLIIVNAGHPRPMLRRAGTGAWIALDAQGDTDDRATNLPLGIIEPTDYAQFAVTLEPGDEIVIVTDSLVESPGPNGKMLGEAGLLQALEALPDGSPQHRTAALLEAITRGAGGAEFNDDVTVVWMRHTATDPPRQSVVQQFAMLGKMLGLGEPI